jgi:hypothetical protein
MRNDAICRVRNGDRASDLSPLQRKLIVHHKENAMKLNLMFVAVMSVIAAGCMGGGKDHLVVVEKRLQTQAHSIGSELGGMATSAESLFWIEGKIQNNGEQEEKNVVIRFKCTDGTTTTVLVAQVPLIAPGGTVAFKTRRHRSPAAIQMLDEDPEVYTD